MTQWVLWSAVVSAAASAALAAALLPWLRQVARQPIREDAPARHRQKAGTPTLGGLAILGGAAAGLAAAGTWAPTVAVAAAAVALYGGVGLVDDWLSLRRGRNLGLRAREKLALQVPVAVGVGWYAARNLAHGTGLWLPGGGTWELGWAYVLFAAVFMVGFANGTNLTDGLDGLAAGCAALALGTYAVVALRTGQPELAGFAASLAGGCLGFLWFNAHPAQVIMGDVGSQALGAAVSTLAILTRRELLLFVVGAVFVLEAASVVVQVTYFKLTKGRRVFRSSPLHHHFELAGWEEPKIVTRFWVLAGLAALAGLVLV
ncbi:MAG: phospho-N-acetylmuramoyl-pentapeptide-transferase [bacterium]